MDQVTVQHFNSFTEKSATRTEADVQNAIASFLLGAGLGIEGEELGSPRLEKQLGDGTKRRIDVMDGRLLIECKRDLNKSNILDDGILQVAGYRDTVVSQNGEGYAAVLTDGLRWVLISPFGVEPRAIAEYLIDLHDAQAPLRLAYWLQSLLGTAAALKPTKQNIDERLATNSPNYKNNVALLTEIYEMNSGLPQVQISKHLWSRMLRTALGSAFKDDVTLFVRHTFLVCFAEIIAHHVLGFDTKSLSAKEIVSGEKFKAYKVANVVEEDFFDWVAEVPGGEKFVRRLSTELSQFDWSTVEHDVLKDLYEAVIPPKIRKELGEYYTPDWLAQEVVDRAVTDPLGQRVLDPSCGSGTFVFHSIRRLIAAGRDAGLNNLEILERAQRQIAGVDIHPVSKVLAAVTYLLALGSDILSARRSLSVPIYIGDSVQWNQFEEDQEGGTFDIPLEAQDVASGHFAKTSTLFSFGEELRLPLMPDLSVDAFESLISDLADKAKLYDDPKQKKPEIGRILSKHGVVQDTHLEGFREVFRQLCELNADGRDHIWGYFIRNQLRPLWMSRPENQFDVLVGNPPWLRYNLMSTEMQSAYKELSIPRNIWRGEKFASKQDLVGLFIVRAVEKYLKVGGTFSFLTPRSVLTAPAYEGFRSGVWSNAAYFATPLTARFTELWDLAAWKEELFPVPSAAIFGARAETLGWQKKVLRVNKSDLSRRDESEVKTRTGTESHQSPYAEIALQGATLSPFYMFFVKQEEDEVAGLLPGPSGTRYARSERSPYERNGQWGDKPGIEGFVEEEFFTEVVTGESLVPFGVRETKTAVLPIVNGVFQERPLDLERTFPHFAERWESCDELHQNLANMSLLDRVDYQRTLRKQLPTARFRVIYNSAGSNIYPVKLVDEPWVVSNKCYWIRAENEFEADYLTALLSSERIIELVNPLQTSGNYGPRDIHRIPFELAIPRFDASQSVHRELAELGHGCHLKVANYLAQSLVSLRRQRAEISSLLLSESAKIDALVRAMI